MKLPVIAEEPRGVILKDTPRPDLLGELDLEETRLAVRDQLTDTEITEADVEKARADFEKVRREILRETYLERLRRPGLATIRMYGREEDERQPLIFAEAEVESFIAAGDHLLPADFFDRCILPRVVSLGRGSRRFGQVMEVAIGCLPALGRLNTSRTHETTHPETFVHFFTPRGPFVTFMRRHGYEAARACAEFEGGGEYRSDKEDREPWSGKRILELVSPVLALLPVELHPAFFRAFGAQSSQSRAYGIEFIQKAPAILAALANGPAERIELWLKLAATGSLSYQKDLLKPEIALKDLEVITHCEKEQPGAFRFFLFCLQEVYRNSGHGGVGFSGKGPLTCLPEYIKKLREAGNKPEETERLLDECENNTRFTPRDRLALLRYRKEIEASFPDGIAGLEEYLVKILACPTGVSRMIYSCAEEKVPEKNLDVYLEQGVKLAAVLGNAADDYFGYRFAYPSKLLAEDPEEFVRRLDRVVLLAEKLKHLRTLIKYHPRSSFFMSSLNRLDDSPEQFDAYLAGAEKVIAACTETDIKTGDYYAEMLMDYGYPKSVFFESNHYPKGEASEAFEGDLDWKTHADRVVQFFLEPENRGPYRWAYPVTSRAPWLSGEKLYEKIDELPPYSAEETQALFAVVDGLKALQTEIYATRNQALVRDDLKTLRAKWYARCEAIPDEVAKVPHGDLFNPDSLNKLRTLIDETCREMAFRRFAYGVIQPDVHVQASYFLRQAHPGTQLAVMGGSLAHALGLIQNPMVNGNMDPLALPFSARAIADGSSVESPDALIESDFGRELRRRLAVIVPRVEGQILAERYATAGFSFVGGKTHTGEDIPVERLNQVNALFGLDANTPFSLMHHNAVRLPPAPTGLEQIYSIRLFQLLGIPMDNLQVCGAGHWPEEIVRIVAATYLLGTGETPVYKAGAFGTTDDERTGYRLMVRGKGVVDRTVPFFLEGIPGDEDRTDKLGSVDPNDFVLGHNINTLVGHALYGGRFAAEGRRWLDRSARLLEVSGVSEALRSTTWIKQHAPIDGIDTPEHHEGVARWFTDLWRDEVVRPGGGLVGQVQGLLANASDEMLTHAEAVRFEQPEDFLRVMRW